LWIIIVWAAGALAALLRLMLGCLAVWRIRINALPYGDRALSAEIGQSLGLKNPIDVLETRPGSMPMTFGVLRPAVFMPSDSREWTEERRRIVLLHELAHVRRGDVAAHLFARTVFAVYWWNPLAWIAWREFLKERERATDDLVLNAGTRASDYAGYLLEVAKSMRASSAMGWAAIAMARRSQLEGRVVAILDSQVNRKAPSRAMALIAAVVAILIVTPLAAVRAQENTQLPADIDAVIRTAISQRNHEILETTAKAAENLRHFDTAKQLLESAAEIRAQVSGQQSADYAFGLLKLGELEQRRNNGASADDFYTRAVGVLGDRPETAKALIFLGGSEILHKNLDQAMMLFQRAQVADPANAGVAAMWMALVRQKQRDAVGAELLFQNALGLVQPDTPQAATVMHAYAQFLNQQARAEEGTDLEARAIAIDTAGKSRAQEAAPGVYKIGDGVSQPKLLQKVEPQYTEEARAAKWQGTVQMNVVIGTDGVARDFKITQALGMGLDQKAIDAVTQWKFEPGKKNGEPVAVIATIQVNFRLL
jgi:TonB family protein